MNDRVKTDIHSLSRDLYLEHPDLWIEFQDKTNDNTFDELVLFLSAKFNYISIIKYVVENELFDLKSTSKNKEFNNVYNHLLYIAKQHHDHEIYNYLLGLYNDNSDSDSDYQNDDITIYDLSNYDADDYEEYIEEEYTEEEDLKMTTIPKYICTHCQSNVFESGYVVSVNKIYTYSNESDSLEEINSSIDENVICNHCNQLLEDITPTNLELLCIVSNCSFCGDDLREVGVIDKKAMKFDDDSNSFVLSEIDYVCSSCYSSLNGQQKQHFNLI